MLTNNSAVVKEMSELTEEKVREEVARGICTPEDGAAMIEALRAVRIAKHRARFARATARLSGRG